MARFVDVIDLPVPLEVAFAELADFSRTQFWDPGVTAAARLDDGPLGIGSRFEVQVSILGQSRSLEYTITEFDPPHRLVLRADDASMRLLDEITFAPSADGTRVAYEVQCTPLGLLALADPLLDLVVLPRIGRAAAEGLRKHGETLGMRPAASPRAKQPGRSVSNPAPPVGARTSGSAQREGALS